MESVVSDVKLEPDSNNMIYSNHDSSTAQQYSQSDDVTMNFVTFRTSVEHTSQMLTDTWMQLHTLLDSYKSQLFSADAMPLQTPNPDDLMKVLMTKEQENNNLHEELRQLNERYSSEIVEKDRRIQILQFEASTEKNEKETLSMSSSQKIRRLESKVRVLEGKLEKSPNLLKSSHHKSGTGGRWSNRPSGRLLPGAGLVERRTPTPTQVARVTPVTTPDKLPQLPSHSSQFSHDVQQHTIKSETDSEMDSSSSKTDNGETYMTQTVPDDVQVQCQEQKFVLNTGEATQIQNYNQENLPSWTGYNTGQVIPPAPNGSLFLCPHCTQSFNNEQALDHHLRASHRKFICPKCYEHYTKKYDLLNHIGLVHGKKNKEGTGPTAERTTSF